MDNLTPDQRHLCMSRIKCRNTKAELLFRRYVWSKGIRGYRTKYKLTGKPDLYFPKRKLAVFIDGCFWHKCPVCFVKPKSKNEYWDKKIEYNVQRDKKNTEELMSSNIQVLRFWEHDIKKNIEECFSTLKKYYEKNK